MYKIMVNDIEIQYDNNQKNEIENVKKYISNNYDLILVLLGSLRTISLVPTTDNNVEYISDLDKKFYDAVQKIFDAGEDKKILDNKDVLPAFYIEYLIRKSKDNEMSLVQPNQEVSDELLNDLIAYTYFSRTATFDDFVNYLKYRENENNIFDWLKEESRFDAYNYLLEVTVEYLKQNDFYFLNTISSITSMMLSQTINNIIEAENEIERELPTLTKKGIDDLFYQFLDYINAPRNWRQEYNELKSSGRLHFEKQKNDIDTSKCYIDDNGELNILLSLDGTIKSFCVFVHEFVHYITMKNSVTLAQFSISEFPSIFFENIAAFFLINIGYSEDVISKVVKDRNTNNDDIYVCLTPLFNDICKYINCGPILRENKVKFYENNFKAIQEAKEKIAKIIEEDGQEVDLSFLAPPTIDINKETDKECDDLIDCFIKNGLLVINGYQYLLDTYLVQQVLKTLEKDSTVIGKMVNITNNLGNIRLVDVLNIFEMNNLFQDSQESCGKVKMVK